MSWDYGRLVAEVYELDKPVGSTFPALRYYTRQLAGVTGRILEPATGTGRVLVPLLEAGFAVEGLDVSPDMLAVCRQHCRDRGLDPVLREADMTALAEPGAYQAIIIPAGSIMLLDGRDEAPRALAAFLESLSPGGRLILDVGVLELISGPAPMRYWERDPYLWTLQDMRTVKAAAVRAAAVRATAPGFSSRSARLRPRYAERVRMRRSLRSCHDTCRSHNRCPRAGHQPEGRP